MITVIIIKNNINFITCSQEDVRVSFRQMNDSFVHYKEFQMTASKVTKRIFVYNGRVK